MGKPDNDNQITPTDEQLSTMAHIVNDYNGRQIRDIMMDIWNYVARETVTTNISIYDLFEYAVDYDGPTADNAFKFVKWLKFVRKDLDG